MQPERSESKVVRNQSLNADVVLFTTPALVGKNGLTVEILFRELALIRFLAVEVLSVEAPSTLPCEKDATECDGLSPPKGDTSGGYDVMVHGKNFGGADFGAEVIFRADAQSDGERCNRTEWINDTMVRCIDAPVGQ